MKTVRQLLVDKGHQIFGVEPDASVLEALELMERENIGAVLVLEADRLAGILSERDYARKIILHGKASSETPVKEIMTTSLTCVGPDRTAEECMALMTDKRIRHLPVLEDGNVIGIISIGDVVKAVISEKEFVIEQLEAYITGSV